MARASTFTSYINSELPSNVEANFARYEQIATRTYTNVGRQAQQASRAVANLVGGRPATGASGSTAATRGLEQQARAARAVAEVNRSVQRESRKTEEQLAREGRMAERVARQNSFLVRNLSALSTSLNVVQGPLGPIAGRVSALAGAITELTGFRLGLAGVAAGLFTIGSMGTTYTQLESRLKAVFPAQRDVNRAMDDVVGIAQRARTSLEPVADLYARLKQNADDFGVSQRMVAQLTETASKAAILSGGQRQSQEAGLYQFGQALGSGNLGGEELRSVKENTAALAQAIADGLGVGVGELKKLASEGKLTTQVVVQAMDKAALDIELRYARLPKTMGQASTEFMNSLTLMVGRTDAALGFTSKIAEIISAAAGSLHFLTSAAVGAGVAFGAIKLTGLIGETAKAIVQARTMHNVVTLLGERRKADAAAAVAQHQREIAALEAEQVQIRETIALLERRRQVAAGDYARAMPDPAAGTAGSERRMRAAVDEERTAVRGLIQERQRLAVVSDGLVGANNRATEATKRLEGATKNAATRSGFFRSAISGLVGVFNPYALAIGAATTALIYLATAQSGAERTAATLSEAQRQLGLLVDDTTGKIHGQIGALELLNRQKVQSEALSAQLEQVEKRRDELRFQVERFTTPQTERQARAGALGGGHVALVASNRPGQQTPAQRELSTLLDRVGKGYSLQAFQRDLQRLAPSIPGLAKELGNLGKTISGVRTASEDALRQAAAVRVATGKARPGDLAVALGTSTVYQQSSQRKKSDLDREAAARAAAAADNPLIAARGRRDQQLQALEQERNKGLADTDYVNRRQQIIESYNAEVKGIQDARKAAAASRREQRAEAAQAIRDHKQEAAARRDAALLGLEQRAPELGGRNTQAFLNERIKILRTYDEEIEKIDARSAASSTAAAQLIADARRVQEAATRAGEKRADILGGYDDAPRALDRAADQIEDLQRFVDTAVDGVAFIGKTRAEIAALKKENPLGTGIYTQAMADADARRIEYGIRKPLRDAAEEHEAFLDVSNLRLAGLDAEARAYERGLDIVREIGRIERDDFQILVDQERQQEAINDVLASRERIVGAVNGALDQARDAFEQLLIDLPSRGLNAGKDFIKNIIRNIAAINARRITESLFSGADAKVRALTQGRDGVERAYAYLSTKMVDAGSSTERLVSGNDRAASSAQRAADALDRLATSAAGAAASPAATGGVPEAAAELAGAVETIINGRPATYKAGVRLGNGIGDDVIASALGGLAVITENLRSQQQQDEYRRRGLTKAKVSAHTTSEDAWDVRLPKGMSFAEATRLIRTTAREFGAEVVSAIDETAPGKGTGPHGHYVIRQRQAAIADAAGTMPGIIGGAAKVLSIGTGAFSLAKVVADSVGTGVQVANDNNEIVVQAQRAPTTAPRDQTRQRMPTGGQVYNSIFEEVGSGLDKIIDGLRGRKTGPGGITIDGAGNTVSPTSFFKGIGNAVGTAFQGAGQGAMASGIARSLGIKQSGTGAAIGGAIGSFLPIPGGAFIGGLIGGTIGGLFKKTKTGSAAVSVDQFGNVGAGATRGNTGSFKKAASGLADNVGNSLAQIAEQFDAEIGAFQVSLGKRGKNFVVDPTGRNRTKGRGTMKFQSEQEAIEFAIRNALADGAIRGISAAAQRILSSGRDLQSAINKALLIESIPKRLLQRTNPVRFAVEQLNDEFSRMIAALKEGGATAEQFADAQKLYELERADAVEQATKQAFGAIDQALKDMMGGSSSPLSRRTVYENAQADFNKFVTDVNGGKVVDQNDLLSAARNFQDASRALNGSGQAFFNDFRFIYDLLTKARDNAGTAANVIGLPPSPFESDSAVKDIIAKAGQAQVDATNNQTNILAGQLSSLSGLMQAFVNKFGITLPSAMDALPMGSGGGRFVPLEDRRNVKAA